MRSISIAIITCLIFPHLSFAAEASENKNSSFTTNGKNTKFKGGSESSRTPDFSSTGRPGQQTAGESRNGCGAANSLQAVIPRSNSGKTLSGHPRFWVYLPTISKNIDRWEFVLQNEAREDVWRSPLKNPTRSGYQNIALPSTQPHLEIGQWYRWYVKAYCKSQVASSYYVQGWVSRIPLTSNLYLDLKQNKHQPYEVYRQHGLWYDAINHLLGLEQTNTNRLAIEQNWQEIIEAGGLCSRQLPYVHQPIIKNPQLTTNY